ncbi:MAG: hypothetical protein MI892_12935, partial [Desulfobacterales bacterium]|nr:hypothetical protein [Desulfobacterales bacterium]
MFCSFVVLFFVSFFGFVVFVNAFPGENIIVSSPVNGSVYTPGDLPIDFLISSDEDLEFCRFTIDEWLTNYTMTVVSKSEGTFRTCTDTFGEDCSLWPASSEGDNTFDDCLTSVGGAGDEHVVEASVNVTNALVGSVVNVTCTFDPYDSGTEEYIYYYNGSSWSQEYFGNPSSGDVHDVSVNVNLRGGVGTHWFRCIVDYNGEDDECADEGSYF